MRHPTDATTAGFTLKSRDKGTTANMKTVEKKSYGVSRVRLFVITFVLCFISSGCSPQPRLEVYLMNIAPMPSTLFEQRVRLDVRIQNLTETTVSASGADLALSVNGKRLARGVSNEPIQIGALADTTTSIVLSSSIFDSVRQLLGLKDREIFTYNLRGKLFTDGLDRRFQRRGEFTRANLNQLLPATAPR
ncbi:MAG: hypothetical protein GKR90_13190 [Pseudomonadales bacterium]|nr:hypothetical protein [Pseudomonadales bacterium]